MRPEKFYADQNIETRLGTKVTAIDSAAQTVTLEDGESLSYSDLVLATGSQVRRLSLPGFDQDGVSTSAPWPTSMVSVRPSPRVSVW